MHIGTICFGVNQTLSHPNTMAEISATSTTFSTATALPSARSRPLMKKSEHVPPIITNAMLVITAKTKTAAGSSLRCAMRLR
jgi:hypothetical protein